MQHFLTQIGYSGLKASSLQPNPHILLQRRTFVRPKWRQVVIAPLPKNIPNFDYSGDESSLSDKNSTIEKFKLDTLYKIKSAKQSKLKHVQDCLDKLGETEYSDSISARIARMTVSIMHRKDRMKQKFGHRDKNMVKNLHEQIMQRRSLLLELRTNDMERFEKVVGVLRINVDCVEHMKKDTNRHVINRNQAQKECQKIFDEKLTAFKSKILEETTEYANNKEKMCREIFEQLLELNLSPDSTNEIDKDLLKYKLMLEEYFKGS